jgi:hypothetical protein
MAEPSPMSRPREKAMNDQMMPVEQNCELFDPPSQRYASKDSRSIAVSIDFQGNEGSMRPTNVAERKRSLFKPSGFTGLRRFDTIVKNFDTVIKVPNIHESLHNIESDQPKEGISDSNQEFLSFFEELETARFSHHDIQTEKRQMYKFLAQLVSEAIAKFPVNVDIKIVNSFIYRQKLFNEFKAIFELMSCDKCNPSLAE